MQCDLCGNLNTRHSPGLGCTSWPRCKWCGETHMPGAIDTGGSWKNIRLEMGLCNRCAIWEERARRHEKNPRPTLIIGGCMYSPEPKFTVPFDQPDPSPDRSTMRGYGGVRFDFQLLDGSPPQTCYSLWHGGQVIPQVRERMPDNARFLKGSNR